MKSFKTKNTEGKEVELEFVSAKAEDLMGANKIYNKIFASLLNEGGLLRKRLSDKLREQGLWGDEKQTELERLQKSIIDKTYKLHKGKIKLSKAKEIALDVKKDRAKQSELLVSYNEYDNNTIEGQADNARFNYMVYACTVYSENKKRYFESYDKFLESSDPVTIVAAEKYASEFYSFDPDFEDSLPENQFLKKFNFTDDKLRLINAKGKLVDEDGNLIDEFGNRIDSKGNIVDVFGYKRTPDGGFSDESSPFLDDKGKPVLVDSVEDSA